MRIAIVSEVYPGERRVAASPESVAGAIKLGYEVIVESGAGLAAHLTDEAYRSAGATVISDTRKAWESADIVLKVRPPAFNSALGVHEAELLREGGTLMSFVWPAQNKELMELLSARKVTVLAMDCVPRISRAQKMDALSSMANIAGYRAVVEAANHFGRFFTGQITAAGKVPPAKVLVIGAGVAGLSAIGTASSLGAVVRAFDTRLEVKDQVKSMGGEFLQLDFEEDGSGEGGYAKVMSDEFIRAEMALFAEQARDVDIIVTTALIPGRPAPKLITSDMVASMKQGSVIVDMAAEQGGNCDLTVPGEVSEKHGVTIIGYTDLPSRLPTQASRLYATNLLHLLTDLTPGRDGTAVVNMDDEVIRGATVIKDGTVTWPPPPPRLSAAPKAAQPRTVAAAVAAHGERKSSGRGSAVLLLAGALLFAWLGSVAPTEFLQHLFVFVLACFVGYKVVWSVTPALHTPLMSVTNAISGIIIIGALLQVKDSSLGVVGVLAIIAILIATINIAGGFLVTQRMLNMFRK